MGRTQSHEGVRFRCPSLVRRSIPSTLKSLGFTVSRVGLALGVGLNGSCKASERVLFRDPLRF